jgi:hypothetical protein
MSQLDVIRTQLIERLSPRSFVPFTIVRKDGTRLHVRRELTAGTDGVRKVAVATSHGMEFFTFSDIESIEVSKPRKRIARRK